MSLRRTAAFTATTLLGAAVAAVAAGRYAAGAALGPSTDSSLPAGFAGPQLTVHATAAGQITLTRSLLSRLPGTYGLTGPESHAVVGPVLDVPSEADTVVRRLISVDRGRLEAGDQVRLTPQLHRQDPADALGIDFAELTLPGELGPLPAWYVSGTRSIWVIAVHGLGATREHTLNLLPFLHRQRLPVLSLSYRGDPGAPPLPNGTGQLGESEWRDLDPAIRHAVRHGAQGIVLYGWSTGATMALHALARSALRDRISGLVLDSPVLDWRATVRSLAGARHVPDILLPLTVRAVLGRSGLTAERLAEAADPKRLAAPTLIVHGPGDTVTPWGASRRFAEERPDLVALHAVQEAQHAAMWNADPVGYEEVLRRFLTPLM